MDSKGRKEPGRFCREGSVVAFVVEVVLLEEEELVVVEGGRQKSSKRSACEAECMWM